MALDLSTPTIASRRENLEVRRRRPVALLDYTLLHVKKAVGRSIDKES